MKKFGTSTFDWWTAPEMPGIDKQMVNAVKEADVLLFMPPGGRGSHIELGVALGNNIPIICLSTNRLIYPRSVFYDFVRSYDSLASFYEEFSYEE